MSDIEYSVITSGVIKSFDCNLLRFMKMVKLNLDGQKYIIGAPQGFWGSGENCYLFSGIWGALVIILGELGSKLIVLGI